jgi:LysR family transcriptional regulator, glycine cleavage system transcriptional activator
VQFGSPPIGQRTRLPPLKALQAFDAVSRQATFAAGAMELGVTPSAVSHQIQLLEDFLGVKLFERKAGKATLTYAGQLYAQEIRTAFSVISNATTRVAPKSESGHLVIACSPSLAAKWLQPRIPDFLSKHPEVKIRLFALSSHEAFDKDSCDVAIVYRKATEARGYGEPLITERMQPLCSPGLSATLNLRAPEDLSRATLIHSINALSWPEYLRRVGPNAMQPANELWLNPSSMAIDAAVGGLGVILETSLLAEQELRDGRLVAPFQDGTFSVEAGSYFLVRPTGFRNGIQVDMFERWIRAMTTTGGANVSLSPNANRFKLG